jgi:S1-C subfamily serine protease
VLDLFGTRFLVEHHPVRAAAAYPATSTGGTRARCAGATVPERPSRFERLLCASLLFASAAGCTAEAGANCWEFTGDANADGATNGADCILVADASRFEGLVGPTGPAGEVGPRGAPGATGATGPTGADADGLADAAGAQGATAAALESAASPGSSFIEQLANRVELQSHAVLAVVCTDAEGGTSYGTGTKTPDGDVITAFHVVNGCTALSLIAGSFLDPVLLASAEAPFDAEQPIAGRDLVVLRSLDWTPTGDALTGIEPAWERDVHLGELTMTVGFPSFFFDAQFASGFVMSASLDQTLTLFGRDVEWSSAFTTDAATAGGASGGPVFDEAGQWFGIHVGASSDPALELSIQIPLKH